ncbi:MAG: response regulator [Caldimonas sp.]
MNILFVEDHPALRYSVAREMRAHGHAVFEAENAEAAHLLLTEHAIDVLVTDVGLPGVSGDVFAAEARAVRPLLRLVLATGLDQVRNSQPSDGGPTVLRKPYSWDDLEKALNSAV